MWWTVSGYLRAGTRVPIFREGREMASQMKMSSNTRADVAADSRIPGYLEQSSSSNVRLLIIRDG